MKLLHSKEVAARSLDNPKERRGMYAYMRYYGSHVIWLQATWINVLS